MKLSTLIVVLLLAAVMIVSGITASQVQSEEEFNTEEKGELLKMCLFNCFSEANAAVKCSKEKLSLQERRWCYKARTDAVKNAEPECALKCGIAAEKL